MVGLYLADALVLLKSYNCPLAHISRFLYLQVELFTTVKTASDSWNDNYCQNVPHRHMPTRRDGSFISKQLTTVTPILVTGHSS